MDDTKGSPPQGGPTSPEHHHIRLACQACQRKKIKCDRNFPCGQCGRSGLQCVPSTRKPRARHVGKRAVDSELRSRISKLESLVESLSGDMQVSEDTPKSEDSETDSQDPPKDTSPAVGKYMGSPFWSSLTTEVQALREALEDEQAEEDGELTTPSTSSGPGNSSAEYDLIICPPGSVYVMPGALTEPPPQVSNFLCEAFCNNVDRMFKIFHGPTLKAFMIEGKSYLGREYSAPCNKAVKAAVWFAATNTLSDEQCLMYFGQPRAEQVQQFRRMVDVSLAQADLMNTTDLATLQAIATYAATARLTDTSRRVWTLAALVVRIARAMGLHHETVARSPFETELRRRLWHMIRFLDVFAGLDRGSELLIALGSYDTPLPRNANDWDFSENSELIPDHDVGLTDMSFAQMAYSATALTHRLTIPESKPHGDTWQHRLESAQKFVDTVQEKYLRYCDTTKPFQRMMYNVAKSMTATMMLRAVRPIQKHVSSTPPRVDDPFVLKLSLDCLKASDIVQNDPETGQWRWMVWVPWHGLACALGGLCGVRDTELANECWIEVEKAYARHSKNIADARNGMLWRPIEKLYRKASAYRDHAKTPSSVSPPQNAPEHPQLPPMTSALSNAPHFDTTTPINSQTMPGVMPTGGLINSPMDMSMSNAMFSGADLVNNDMTWIDFERIFDEMNTNPSPNVNLGDMQWPQTVAPGQEWPCGLHQNLM